MRGARRDDPRGLSAKVAGAGSEPLRQRGGHLRRVRAAARAEAKESVAPPEDALEKDSVAVFFALLGAFPIAIMIAGLAGGARPFGL